MNLARALYFIGIVFAASCGAGNKTGSSSSPTPPSSPPPQSSNSPKIFMVIEENHKYEQLVGSPRMPFLNSLIASDAVADNYYANSHPSLPNYFMLTTGQLITNSDLFDGTVSDDNLARELNQAGRTWHVYAEGLPSVGFLGKKKGEYRKRHNPFAYFSDVVSDSTQANNLLPFSQFAADLQNGNTADFNLIIPDLLDDMHSCPTGMPTCEKEKTADDWLQVNISPLFSNADFLQRGIFILTTDESLDTDLQNGGGHVLTVLGGPLVIAKHRSSTLYQHPSLLRLVCEELKCPQFPGAAASAPSMQEFMQQGM